MISPEKADANNMHIVNSFLVGRTNRKDWWNHPDLNPAIKVKFDEWFAKEGGIDTLKKELPKEKGEEAEQGPSQKGPRRLTFDLPEGFSRSDVLYDRTKNEFFVRKAEDGDITRIKVPHKITRTGIPHDLQAGRRPPIEGGPADVPLSSYASHLGDVLLERAGDLAHGGYLAGKGAARVASPVAEGVARGVSEKLRKAQEVGARAMGVRGELMRGMGATPASSPSDNLPISTPAIAQGQYPASMEQIDAAIKKLEGQTYANPAKEDYVNRVIQQLKALREARSE